MGSPYYTKSKRIRIPLRQSGCDVTIRKRSNNKFITTIRNGVTVSVCELIQQPSMVCMINTYCDCFGTLGWER